MSLPRPCTAAEASTRALKYVNQGTYVLGGGGYLLAAPDASPFRPRRRPTGELVTYALDCSGFVTWCYRLPRDRKPFNRGPWANISDAINTDSIVDDAEHKRELFEVVTTPAVGDLIVYPGTWDDTDDDGDEDRVGIGHVGLIVGVPAEWDPAAPQYELLTVAHCSPSSAKRGWRTGIKRTDGKLWVDRAGRAKTRIVRVRP